MEDFSQSEVGKTVDWLVFFPLRTENQPSIIIKPPIQSVGNLTTSLLTAPLIVEKNVGSLFGKQQVIVALLSDVL